MGFIFQDGSLVFSEGKPIDKCECCQCSCCWRITAMAGCPGPEVTISDAGKGVLLCFQDSGNCGELNCESVQEDTGGCGGTTPCDQTQTVALSTKWNVLEPTTLTVTLEGRVEVVNPGFDETTVTVGDVGSVTIGSSMGITGGGDCSMNFVSKSESFEIEPGCLNIRIKASTVDSLWHFGMYSKITFAFTDDSHVEACSGGLCTTFECQEGTTCKSADEPPDLEEGVDPCTPVEGNTTCVPVDAKPEEAVPLEQCVEGCNDTGECKVVRFYCCVKTDDSEPPGDTGGIVNLEPPSRDCVKRKWRVCSTAASGTPTVELPEGAYESLAECREGCPPPGYECVDGVCTPAGGENPTYPTLEACEQACLGRFVCDDVGECIQTIDPEAPYATREECEEDCDSRYDCAPNGGCYRSADGPYATREECNENCDPPPPEGYYCVLEGEGEAATVICKAGSLLLPEDEVVGGPHATATECVSSCQKHECQQTCKGPVCAPSATGQYASLEQCLGDCEDPAADACTLETATGIVLTTDGGTPAIFEFDIDAAPRWVCISYVSLGGQSVRVQGQYITQHPTTCQPIGVATTDSYWRGYKECDCPDDRNPGSLKGPPKGYVIVRKPRGPTKIFVRVFAPCPDSEVTFTIRCEKGPCHETSDPDPRGACCDDGECVPNVTKSQCLDIIGGKWLGPCSECGPEDCIEPRGACCLPDGTCLEKTESECDDAGGTYQGDNTFCFEVTCPPPPPVGGACCFPEGCTQNIPQSECELFGGEYLGDGTTCGPPNPCLGNCCLDGETIPGLLKGECEDVLGGVWTGSGQCCQGQLPTYAESLQHEAYYVHMTATCGESWFHNLTLPLNSFFTNNCAFSCVRNYQGWLGLFDTPSDAWVAMRASATEVDLFTLFGHLRTFEGGGVDLAFEFRWQRRNILSNAYITGGNLGQYFSYGGNPFVDLCLPIGRTQFGPPFTYNPGLLAYAASGCPPYGNFLPGDATTAGCLPYYGQNAGDYGVTVTANDICQMAASDPPYTVRLEVSPLP